MLLKTVKKPFSHFLLGFLSVVLSTSFITANGITITNPTARDILYGSSKIKVVVSPDLKDRIASIDFFLAAYPRPICRDNDPPYECLFDAGEFFEGWEIAAKAYDRRGKLVTLDTVKTKAFPKPVRVTKYILENVPVRIISLEELPELSSADFDCYFGEEACTVTQVKKLSDLLDTSEAGEFRAYLEILLDVSGSMKFSRENVRRALEYLVDRAPKNTQIRFSSFSDYNSLNILTADDDHSGFTSNKEVIKKAIKNMGPNIGKSCIFHSMEKLIYRRPDKEVFRNILLITDCMDTCDWIKSRRIVATFSKELGYVIDLLKIGRSSQDYILQKACETMATDTSGQIFRAEEEKDLDLLSVMKEIVSNLYEMHLFDIDLPDHVEEEKELRFQLIPKRKKIELKYAEYRLPALLDSVSLDMLKSEETLIRQQALRRLSNSEDPEILKKLIKAFKSEPTHDLRIEILLTVYELIGSHLLHQENPENHKLALKAASGLKKINPEFIEPIKPYLNTYLKTNPPEEFQKKIAPLLME
jgi:hypothetical protein